MPVLPGGRVRGGWTSPGTAEFIRQARKRPPESRTPDMSEQVLDQSTALLEQFANREYEHGWSVDLEVDQLPPGLNEDVVRALSAKKEEPEWLLEWRLKAYRHLLTVKLPKWPNVNYEMPDRK